MANLLLTFSESDFGMKNVEFRNIHSSGDTSIIILTSNSVYSLDNINFEDSGSRFIVSTVAVPRITVRHNSFLLICINLIEYGNEKCIKSRLQPVLFPQKC